jgi:hypothetical protein
MHGVPAELPVQRLVGDSLFQVCIGIDGIHFCFGRSGTISVSGGWELLDQNGTVIDCACEFDSREAYRVHAIFNQEVTKACLDPPKSFSLTFANEYRLTIFDDLQGYESFSFAGYYI